MPRSVCESLGTEGSRREEKQRVESRLRKKAEKRSGRHIEITKFSDLTASGALVASLAQITAKRIVRQRQCVQGRARRQSSNVRELKVKA